MNLQMRAIRNDFQDRYPHYTPPPWASNGTWLRWRLSNIRLHGEAGFRSRFPAHDAAYDFNDVNTSVDRWRSLSYPNGLRA